MDSDEKKLKEIKKVKKRIDKGKAGKIVKISKKTKILIAWIIVTIIILATAIIPIFAVKGITSFGINKENPNLNPQIQRNFINKGENK